MKIGRTNAITISGGGGTTKSPYDEWQEGFGANWDSVIQNAPQTGQNPVLHIYTKVNSIRHVSYFPTNVTIVTYNPTTGIYRPVVVDANKNLFFEESDYFMNSYDGFYYTCVIYKAYSDWGDWRFRTTLPVVYSNTKFCTGSYTDMYISLISENPSLYPFLRGVDCNTTNNINIGNSLEHLTMQNYFATVQIVRMAGSDQQARILKDLIDNAPIGTTFTFTSNAIQFCVLSISDEKLADWFYNDLYYNKFSGVSYRSGFPVSNVVKIFRIRPDINFYNQYLSLLPNMVYIDGVITEDQTKIADINAGLHNFRNSGWTMLQNFPMWKVIGSATTGCLLPMNTQTNVNNYLAGSFDFHSTNLEPNKFCEFDENGIIEDATKYFICNLPVETISHTNIQVRFRDLTFKDNYTSEQQSAISTYLTNKNWSLQWS